MPNLKLWWSLLTAIKKTQTNLLPLPPKADTADTSEKRKGRGEDRQYVTADNYKSLSWHDVSAVGGSKLSERLSTNETRDHAEELSYVLHT